MNSDSIFQAIIEERERQERLHPLPFARRIDSADMKAISTIIIYGELLAVLMEEVGEVGKAMQGDGDLQEELIQVAAVCVRWLELKNPAE